MSIPVRGGTIPRNDPTDDWLFDEEIQALRQQRRVLDTPATCHLCRQPMTRKELVTYTMTCNTLTANGGFKKIMASSIVEYCECGGESHRAYRPGETLEGIPERTVRV